jgi:ABC-type multidrug transport system fused ATPase/permease subunit
MINKQTFKMAWSLLDEREKRNAWFVLLLVIVSAFSASAMVASIMPFLTVLAAPERIQEISLLREAYRIGQFEDNTSFLFALGLASIIVIILANAFQILRVFLVTRYIFGRAHSISFRMLSSYLRQPYSFFLKNHSGEMGTKVLSESQQVVTQFFKPVADACASSLTILALFALLLYVNPVLSLSIFGLFGGIYGATLVSTRRMVKRIGRERTEANAARYKIANEALTGVKDIKLLAREWAYLDRYAKPSRSMTTSLAKVQAISQVPQYVMHALAFGGMVLLCLILLGDPSTQSREYLAGILPTIGLMAFAGQRMIPELSSMFQSLTALTYGDASVRSVSRDMSTQSAANSLPRTQAIPLGLKESLIFENVGYKYENGGNVGLANISLQIAAGERIGVVGTTGAGKSTLANILLALIAPTEGRFIVDGKEITPDRTRSWQRSLGYVPQEIFLMDGSIRQNIAFGIPMHEIDEERVQEVARLAHLHDFILTELNEGYDTEVGERGIRLSGGQRQRIAIARALYHDADLILLDEATSALDNTTENDVIGAIETLPGDKTLIMIAHRLSTLRRCDRIIVLDQGQLSGFANWQKLSEENATFRHLLESINHA